MPAKRGLANQRSISATSCSKLFMVSSLRRPLPPSQSALRGGTAVGTDRDDAPASRADPLGDRFGALDVRVGDRHLRRPCRAAMSWPMPFAPPVTMPPCPVRPRHLPPP